MSNDIGLYYEKIYVFDFEIKNNAKSLSPSINRTTKNIFACDYGETHAVPG